MIKRLLIANRGEIALRIQRAARALGIETVQIHSTADAGASFVRAADLAVCVGPAATADSYLNMPRIIAAALASDCDAVHPGYGLLSENPEFAALSVDSGLLFVGPHAECIAKMGDKIAARNVMTAAGVPCVPGTNDPLPDDLDACRRVAAGIGYPVMVKAAHGGGGRGMRVVRQPDDLAAALKTTRAEARSAFGDGTLFMERFLDRPRHVEIQILADTHGNAVHLGERDCSMQRRHQKVIEEAPAMGVSRALIDATAEACLRACRDLGYAGAGTFEFLYQDGEMFFIEMNTRLQVEHCVTEAITGIDIVQWQLRIAAGETLTLRQEDIALHGHAVECRINAEDPETFAPTPGRVRDFIPPAGNGIRVETHLEPGAEVPPYYDGMVAKLVTSGRDRTEAIDRMMDALAALRIDGIQSNAPLHRRLLRHPAFREGPQTIHFIEHLDAPDA
ncbi:acetyl-CoA carboxylase biotin carboxylase subunit [Salipiger mangrovisoli]|uniref:Acetyl-CoA carboxylase biotin carboxylase subunit n=1 Tax=Salipiger mangrovisoli TaxID=2865933 RepID=A0ABR9X916_9RHOB|nr:acetyl-CoA carboxylase biotin carboxylase subunit [Salipiger mangrovisoli]MBE9640032.1 acetyl-CoA carboxylase biotin carboxylase subunit [Salipiger mangrovisoli]